ncbi:MAG: hypothetical protein M1812_005418 [Candelaria pacifica]|nr:MAG: hypothetical protein M1812_005418 [Candelaria pacifica]
MSTRGQFNTKNPTIKRILKEANELATTPSLDLHATPLESNLFEWHFTLRGPPSPSPYANGLYHGRIILPPTYPLRPPSFRFLTPTGRFEVNREICLSISGHHEETWQPAWGIRTAMVAIRSFMDSEAKGQLGGLDCEEGVRRRMATESARWRCAGCGKSNGEIIKECEDAVEEAEKEGKGRKLGGEEGVPPELRLAYRDEMETKQEDSKERDKHGSSQSHDPLQDQNSIKPSSQASSSNTVMGNSQVPPRTTTPSTASTPRPAPTQITPRPTPTTTLLQPRVQPISDQGVPGWVDKAICGVVACLVIMILKKVF